MPPHRESRRDDGTGPTALPGECHFYQYEVQNAIRRIAFRTLGGSQRPNLLKEQEVEKGRNARAISTRSRAFPISPATSVTAIHRLVSVESSNVFGEATLRHNVLRRN